jgi:hypothetical protein
MFKSSTANAIVKKDSCEKALAENKKIGEKSKSALKKK